MDWTYLVIEILQTAALYTIFSIGVNLLWNSNKFFDFGHIAMILFGAYGYYAVHAAGFPWFVAAFASIAVSIAVALVAEVLVYMPLRKKRAASLMCMVASLGVMTLAQGILLLRFGEQPYTVLDAEIYTQILGTRISVVQIAAILVGVSVFCLVGYMYTRTKLGLSMRAVADNPVLARVMGVPVERIRMWCVALSAACAGIVGVLQGMDSSITPGFAMPLLLNAIVVSLIFGLGNVTKGAYVALILACLQVATVWYVGAGWSAAIAFLFLIALLLYRSSQKTYGISYSS